MTCCDKAQVYIAILEDNYRLVADLLELHGAGGPSPEPIEWRRCPVCGKSFANKGKRK